ncbi:uncharacterized protein DEA37_0005566 [Paragonimus westermani]|uniref:Uncharacterized protein n=1 Tax=Paragonimus westermani TaxID=34504 RepID=A0A5J4NJM0_9TREM|nr:uncharacterized protein DEA37_0005566 [Paragonimus westermani]
MNASQRNASVHIYTWDTSAQVGQVLIHNSALLFEVVVAIPMILMCTSASILSLIAPYTEYSKNPGWNLLEPPTSLR